MSILAFTAALPLRTFTSPSIFICNSSRIRLINVNVTSKTKTTSLPLRLVPSSMFGFLREMMGGTATNTGAQLHTVLGKPLLSPDGKWDPPLQQATFGMGCVGYIGGTLPKPTYQAVCSGRTGHAEVVNVVFDSSKTSYEQMLNIFWDSHDPTTKDRQGNDVGTQYRSAIYYYDDEQKRLAEQTRDHYSEILKADGRNACTTEVEAAPEYYIAENYHQQHLHKNPSGYCGLGGTGLYRPRDAPK